MPLGERRRRADEEQSKAANNFDACSSKDLGAIGMLNAFPRWSK
jgi:hypothetical protein